MEYDLVNLGNLPSPSEERIAIHVSRDAERQIRSGHPWLYESAIRSQNKDGSPGDLAVVFNRSRKFIGIGLYDPLSYIRVRILQHKVQKIIGHTWFQHQFENAITLRKVLPINTTGYRLINGENDNFPGLIIDKYDKLCVIKLYTAAWVPYLNILINMLVEAGICNVIVLRLNRILIDDNPFPEARDGSVLYGSIPKDPFTFLENGLRFEVDPFFGHKTGFYLDQRENREIVEQLSSGKRILNVFSYTGGFSVYAARGEAKEIISVDISQKALDVSRSNFILNSDHPGVNRAIHNTLCSDTFSALDGFLQKKQTFDLIVIDPPSFAKSLAEKSKALRNYARLTQSGLAILSNDGYLVQSSCSNKITSDEFYKLMDQSFEKSDVEIKIIEKTGHPIDHPVTFLQGNYLKTIFARKSGNDISRTY